MPRWLQPAVMVFFLGAVKAFRSTASVARRSVVSGGPPLSALRLRDASTGESRVVGAAPKWYACGPTVYDAAHLGHARTYVTLDVVRRVAERYGGAAIDFAMGVTDIDDKIIKRAVESGVEPAALAREEEVKFFADMQRLGCKAPSRLLRVSEHVPEIVAFVEEIVAAGNAYATPAAAGQGEDVWFDVERLGELYGAFAEGKGTSAAAVAKAEDPQSDSSSKRRKRDFALWKAAKSEDEPGWDSPWGRGRPGWHIECSAMTRAAFGKKLDLHAGGIDLAFPHHENEIAQWRGLESDGREGQTWCQCWTHTGHLHIEGRKMSKSLKNFITVKQLLNPKNDLHCTPDEFRLFCLTHRYRNTVSLTLTGISEASKLAQQLRLTLDEARDFAKPGSLAKKKFGPEETSLNEALLNCRQNVREALLDDVDSPRAVAEIVALAAKVRAYLVVRAPGGAVVAEPLDAAAALIAETLTDLGCASFGASDAAPEKRSSRAGSSDYSGKAALQVMAAFRAKVRGAALAAKDDERKAALRGVVLKECDEVRGSTALKDLGFALIDLPDGSPLLRRRVPEDDLPPPKNQKPMSKPKFRDVPPEELFQTAEDLAQFSEFDDEGIPTKNTDGTPISKSLSKKLRKKLDTHTTKWQERQAAAKAAAAEAPP